jgi:nicotinamide mononucleotide (NMN) deamidase PncC
VFISVFYKNKARTVKRIFKGSRTEIRNAASDAVISEILKAVEE